MDSKLHVASLQVFEWFIKLLLIHIDYYSFEKESGWGRRLEEWKKVRGRSGGIKIMYDFDDMYQYIAY